MFFKTRKHGVPSLAEYVMLGILITMIILIIATIAGPPALLILFGG